MGFCSGTQIFDDVAGPLLCDESLTDDQKVKILVTLISKARSLAKTDAQYELYCDWADKDSSKASLLILIESFKSAQP